jgi:glycosyltransferase involved in cell wall biosynthesis
MSEKQRIILVSELFYPDESSTSYILTKISYELARDFDLMVLTGPVSYEGGEHYNSAKPLIDELGIKRVWVPELNKNNLFKRFLRFLLLTIGLGWKTLLKSRHSDIIFTVTNPAPLLVALAIIKKLRGFRLVFLVHDVFPENVVALGIIRDNHFIYPFIRWIFDWAYNSADRVITIGRDMSEVIAKKNPAAANKIVLIENWADYPMVERVPRHESMIPKMGLSDRIVIQYAGNIGRAQGLLEFLDLVSTISNDYVRFVFRGSGAMSTALREATLGRDCFILEGAYLRSDQSLILASCDIALVILGPNMYGLGVPSKTYNVLASGKPVLFLGPKDSEIYRLIKSNDIGWAFDWHDANKFIQFVDKLSILDLPAIEARGNKARELAETSFSEARQLAKFKAFFDGFQTSTTK